MKPIYCCIPIEFIQPWEQHEAIRQVKACGLGNMVMIQGTCHVGNAAEERQRWKTLFPHLAEQIDAVPAFPARPQHGMAAIVSMPLAFRLEQLALCRELGLAVFGWLLASRDLAPEERAALDRAGEGIVWSESLLCENTSLLIHTLPRERLKQLDAMPASSHAQSHGLPAPAAPSFFDDPEALDFQAVQDWFIARFRRVYEGLRPHWPGAFTSVEASVQLRLAMAAGTTVPIFEMVPSEPLRGLAATRGAAKAYGAELWGVHAAMGYYRAPTDAWTPERLRIAYDLFYAGGGSFFSEPNLALRNWGACSGFFTVAGSPDIRWAEEECRGFDDPLCVRSREVLRDFYRFSQFHPRPDGGPRVRLGFLLGNLDGWTGSRQQSEGMWLVDHPGFRAADALKTWRHFERIYDSEPWYVPPHAYYWQADPAKPLRHGTPPCGQVDLVPAEAPASVLQEYGTLALLGWNTMTEALYEKLLAFVAHGGTLFLAVPHLDTRTRTDRPPAFLREGDVRALCGVRLLGPGATVEEVSLREQTANPRCVFPQGTLYLEGATLAQLELAGARVLAHPRGLPEQPVLLEHRVGTGFVYLLATWDYPGERLDAFITDILRTLAEAEQEEIAVAGRDVFYAVYDGTLPSGPACATVYLVNHDLYGQPAYPELIVRERRLPVRVGSELRVAWILDDLVIAPHDRFVAVADARREADGWTVILEALPAEGERRVQIESAQLRAVTLDGQALPLQRGIEGDHAVSCRLEGRQTLRIMPK